MKQTMDEKIYFTYGNGYENEEYIEFINNVKQIYNRMLDEKSRKIFEKRLLFALLNDFKNMREIICETSVGKVLETTLAQRKNLYIYGAGIVGTRLPKLFPDMDWKGYIDIHKTGYCNNYPIYTLDECRNLDIGTIVIAVNGKGESIKQKLLELKISYENILNLDEFNQKIQDEMYFDKDCVKTEYMLFDTFVDGGCFDAKDTKQYYTWCGNENSKVFAFEADLLNFNKCKKETVNYKNCRIYHMGISDKEEKLYFTSAKGDASSFSKDGDVEVFTDSLDKILCGEKIGFIKMDIEGCEENALWGARKIISEQHPIIAVSIYHKRTDIWKIPKLLLQFNPNYYFCLRHYSVGIAETVLYAVDKKVLDLNL